MRSNLRVGSPFTPPFLKAPPLILKVKPRPLKSKLLIRARESLVSLPRGLKERNVLSVMVLEIFKLIVPIERPLPSRRYKRFEPLSNSQVAKRIKMMVLP